MGLGEFLLEDKILGAYNMRALGPSGLLDFVLRALRALRPCDPRNGAMIVNTLSTD